MLVSGVLLGQITVAKKNKYSAGQPCHFPLHAKGINWNAVLDTSPGPLGLMAEWFIKEMGFLEEGKKDKEGKKGTRLRMLNDRFLL